MVEEEAEEVEEEVEEGVEEGEVDQIQLWAKMPNPQMIHP
jgi:hypothetical protein